MKAKILLVDDEELCLERMRSALAADYTVFTASRAGDAMSLYEKERPPVVTLDLALNPADSADLGGIRLLEQILKRDPSTRAIVITGHDNDTAAKLAMELGAFDYYIKPIRLDELKVMIHRGVHLHRLLRRARRTKHGLGSGSQGLSGSIKTTELASFPLDPMATDVNLKLAKRAIEMDFVKRALARNRGVVSRAARELGISRVSLYDMIQKYDIRPNDFKGPPDPGVPYIQEA